MCYFSLLRLYSVVITSQFVTFSSFTLTFPQSPLAIFFFIMAHRFFICLARKNAPCSFLVFPLLSFLFPFCFFSPLTLCLVWIMTLHLPFLFPGRIIKNIPFRTFFPRSLFLSLPLFPSSLCFSLGNGSCRAVFHVAFTVKKCPIFCLQFTFFALLSL